MLPGAGRRSSSSMKKNAQDAETCAAALGPTVHTPRPIVFSSANWIAHFQFLLSFSTSSILVMIA